MARFGNIDYKELVAFKEKVEKLGEEETKELCGNVADNLAQRFLNEVKRVPPHPYDTGYLRKNWLAGKKYDNGTSYFVIVKNDVKYASYVEYGHRQEVGRFVPKLGKKLVAPYVAGQFMMTHAIQKVQGEADGIARKMVDRYLKEKLNNG